MKNFFKSIKLPNFYTLRQAARENFLDLAAFPYVKLLAGLSLAVVVLSLVFSYKIIHWSSQDLLVLHYNVNTGIDLIGGLGSLYILPLLGLVILAANTIAAMVIERERKFMGYLLLSAALVANSYLLLSLGLIYIINFR